MTTSQTHSEPAVSRTDVERLVELITPTSSQVTDWHRVRATLTKDWDRPLVKIMRQLVDPNSPPSDFDLRSENDMSRDQVIALDDVALVEVERTVEEEVVPLAA